MSEKIDPDQRGPRLGDNSIRLGRRELDAYKSVLGEIKIRLYVLDEVLQRKVTPTPPGNIDLIAIEIRFITELIALGTLTANLPLFEKLSRRFRRDSHPEKILRDIERINPGFYPIPVTLSESEEGSLRMSRIECGYLTKGDLLETWTKCSEILHARNPFGPEKSRMRKVYEFLSVVPVIKEKIFYLLNCHIIELGTPSTLYVMALNGGPDGRPAALVGRRLESTDG